MKWFISDSKGPSTQQTDGQTDRETVPIWH